MSASELINIQSKKAGNGEDKYATLIHSTCNKASELTHKLLAFGRKGKLTEVPVDINSIIDDSIDIFERTFNKQITIVISKEANNSTIIGNYSSLQNVIMNIGINASHAMNDSGELKIETHNIIVDDIFCESNDFDIIPGEYIEIAIKDSGTGISIENLSKIFEPFFTTKESGKGTGLGLAAVYGTIQDHHGTINVFSDIGIGTSFHIMLPCSTSKVEYSRIESDIIMGSGLILLVDDEEMIRNTLKTLLEELGYQVLIAENGVKALTIFNKFKNTIDLVITDMIMPEMNGNELFTSLREIEPTTKVIISSGYTKDENINDLFAKGLIDFIKKPFNTNELSQIIAKALKG